jgi:hypothetical protein
MGSVFYLQDMKSKDLNEEAWMKNKQNDVIAEIPRESLEMRVFNSNFTNNYATEATIILT